MFNIVNYFFGSNEGSVGYDARSGDVTLPTTSYKPLNVAFNAENDGSVELFKEVAKKSNINYQYNGKTAGEFDIVEKSDIKGYNLDVGCNRENPNDYFKTYDLIEKLENINVNAEYELWGKGEQITFYPGGYNSTPTFSQEVVYFDYITDKLVEFDLIEPFQYSQETQELSGSQISDLSADILA